jgi:molybdopterin synthase catalytic subunit
VAEVFALSERPIDAAALRARLAHHAAGGVCVFEGVVRDRNDGRRVASLRYEAYAELAQREGERVVGEALARWPLLGVACMHRTGELALGDLAVWVGVAAGHRAEAFDACRFLIDSIKGRLPIWKREDYADGGGTRWLHP